MTLRIIIFFIQVLHIAIVFFMVPRKLDLLSCFSDRFFLYYCYKLLLLKVTVLTYQFQNLLFY